LRPPLNAYEFLNSLHACPAKTQGDNVHLAKAATHARGVCWYSSWAADSWAPSHSPTKAPTPRPTGTRYPSPVPSPRPTFVPTPEPTWVYNSILFSAGEGSYGLMKYIEETDTYTKMSQLAGEQVTSIVVDRRRDEEPMVGNRVRFCGRCRLSCVSRAFCILFTCVCVRVLHVPRV
jgi:hypothetical protein